MQFFGHILWHLVDSIAPALYTLQILCCDAADVVALLPGHETSRGSTIEKLYAELMRKPIVTVEWMVEGEEE